MEVYRNEDKGDLHTITERLDAITQRIDALKQRLDALEANINELSNSDDKRFDERTAWIVAT